jgi:rhodanese-related sulfurtransferase
MWSLATDPAKLAVASLISASHVIYAYIVVQNAKTSAFMSGATVSTRARAIRPVRASRLVTKAEGGYIREYPVPEFIAEVTEAFPDQMIANPEEARVLFSELGYKFLDVRPELELDATGKVKGCINVPLMHAKYRYDTEKREKVLEKTEIPEEEFIAAVEKRIPDKSTPILVCCSDGTAYSMDALGALDDAGYEVLVGLKGGFYAWYRTWDANLRRRRGDGYQETYMHDGDSCGIHASGAGFAQMADKIEAWVPPKF